MENSKSGPIIGTVEKPDIENKDMAKLDQVAPGGVKIERHATFYVEDEPPMSALEEKKMSEKEKLIRYIDDNLIGKDQTFVGPFGRRKVVYCDYTASARSLRFIETYIMKEVLPLYGNTNSTIAVTSMQTTNFREEARTILKQAVNASEDDVVLFAGSGCTGAVKKLIHALNLTAPPIVFVGPCEHDSNLLRWSEIGAKIIRISETKEGVLDLNDLQCKLEFQKSLLIDEVVMIGCFSAASNITGILADDVATTILLHQYGALAVWDYATAGPYVTLDMNPLVPGIDQHTPHKDAMFFSGHKFVGGVQSTGILVAKKSLFTNEPLQQTIAKTMCCNPNGSNSDTEFKEEEGTVAIIEAIRTGLVVKLKQAVTVPAIMERQGNIVKTVLSFIRNIPEITLLGSSSHNVNRLAVFSVMVRHPRGSFLHHNFICAVLNDVFGIQARGGCACAGPYAQDLMGISKELASHLEDVLTEDKTDGDHQLQNEDPHSSNEMLRPGFTRISFPYFMSEDEISFVLEALKMVATEGWKLLPQYVLNPETGEWKHSSNTLYRERKLLSHVKFTDGNMIVNERKSSSVVECPEDYAECLKTARTIFNRARKIAKRHPSADQYATFDKDLNALRWFMLPSEAQDLLLGHSRNVKQDVPFCPSTYRGSKPHTNFLLYMKRHHSLIAESEYNSYARDIKMLTQRSESNSPARNDSVSRLLPHSSIRERCYSLGSSLFPEMPNKRPPPRRRLLSSSSQADYTDSEASSPSDHDSRGEPSLRLTPDLVYVEGITKEIATELKSEIRDIIAQVDDVLLENSEFGIDRRSSTDLPKLGERKSHPVPIDSPKTFMSPNNSQATLASSNSQQSLCSLMSKCTEGGNVMSSTISAERFSKYLEGFTNEVVSEMKSELRDVVSAVDGMMSPQPDAQKIAQPTEPLPEGTNWTEQQFSQDSGVSLTETSSSPPSSTHSHGNEIMSLEQPGDTIIADLVETLKNQARRVSRSKPPKNSSSQWLCPTRSLWKPALEAMKEFDMIHDGDKVLVCLSGGKDSLALLHILHQHQYYCNARGTNFTIGAAIIGVEKSEYYRETLIPYLETLGVRFRYEDIDPTGESSTVYQKSICSFCSHVKRSKLYNIAREHGFNVLALGQHLNDVSESFIMSVFHNGYLRSMKAHYIVRGEDLRVIRPMIYVQEDALTEFAETRKLPVRTQRCSVCSELPKERQRIKQLLAQQETLFPNLFLSIKSALKPLISLRYTGLECSDARLSWKSSTSESTE